MRCWSSLEADQLYLWISDTLRDVKIWFRARLPRLVAEDSAATAEWSVRGVFSPDELEEAIQLAAAQEVDSDGGTRVTVQGAVGHQSGGDKRRRSRQTRLEDNLMRRMGESTLVDVDDARVQSFEVTVSEAEDWKWRRVWSAAPAARRAGGDSFRELATHR